MAASKSKAKDATSWEDILAEMNDKSQMEDLRAHLKNYGLFPRDVDPDTAPIKFEYLQKLARQWKLHHKRGFWKEHASQSALVVGLHQHHVTLMSSAKAKSTRTGRDDGKDAGSKDTISPEREAGRQSVPLPEYGGDKFGTRGDYVDGTMYLSRFMGRRNNGDDMKRSSGGAPGENESKLASGAQSLAHNSTAAEDGSDDDDYGEFAMDTSETAKNCAMALCSFSSSTGFHSRIIAAGALASLVETWNVCEEGMKDDVAVALCQLASDESKTTMIEEGALPAILSLATSRKPEVQQLCAATLALLSSVEENVVVLLLEGGLIALESLAASSDAGTRLLAANVLRNMASLKGHRALMIKEDAIKTLLPLSTDTMVETRRNAAIALACLCSHKRSQQKIISEGVSSHLLRLVKSDDADTQGCASRAICALCHNKSTRLRLVREGVVPVIVRQAQSKDVLLQQKAATALLHLSCEEGPVRVEILDNNAIPVLLSLATSGSDKARRGCAMALCNVLCHEETQHKILELNALAAFDALASCKDVDIQHKAAATLLRLVQDAATGLEVVRRGGLSPIMALVGAPSLDIKLECVSALQFLSTCTENHAAMVAAGVVEKVNDLVALPDDRFKLGCAQILTNISCSASVQEKLKERGVIPTLLRLASFDGANSYAAVGLCNFTANTAMRRFLIDSGAVQILIGLAKSTSESTKQECCRAICNLSSMEGCEQVITSSGGAAGLIMVALFRSDTAETKGICASALLNLMTQPQCREQLIKEDVVWVLIKLASSEDSNDSTRSVCGRAICSLSYNLKGCAKLLEHKAIPAIFMLCRDGDERTKRYASITLCNLSAQKENHNAMLNQGAVNCLVELADTEDVETRLHSVGALCNLSTSLSSRQLMIEQHAAAALNLAKCANKETMRRCAIALVNLSSVVAMQGEFVTQGALSGLLQLCSDASSPLIKILCARALYNLSFNPQSREELVKANALSALVSVAHSDSEYTVSLCSVAFYNISRTPACHVPFCESGALSSVVSVMMTSSSPDTQRACYLAISNVGVTKQLQPQLVDSGAIRALCALASAQPDNLELCRVCVRLVRNLSFSAPLRGRMVELGVCKTLISFASSKVEEVRDDCVVGMCNLARDDASVPTIVSEGIVRALTNASKSASSDIQRLIAGAYVYLTRPADLRLRLADDGILDSLAVLLKADLDDVRKMCSTSVRNLSQDVTVQARMVETGMLSLLIGIMSVKEEGRRSPTAASHHKHTVLPNPVEVWEPGRPSDASDQIVVPAFHEDLAPAVGDDYADEDSLEDLGGAAGLVAAHAMSRVALGEPLWTKLQVGDMILSSPSPVVQLASRRDVSAPAVKATSEDPEDGDSGELSVAPPAPVSLKSQPSISAGAGSEGDAEELYFDFKLSSPSAAFYQKQAARGPKATISFEPQYSKIPTGKPSTAPHGSTRSPVGTPTKLPKLTQKSPSPRTTSKVVPSPSASKLPKVA